MQTITDLITKQSNPGKGFSGLSEFFRAALIKNYHWAEPQPCSESLQKFRCLMNQDLFLQIIFNFTQKCYWHEKTSPINLQSEISFNSISFKNEQVFILEFVVFSMANKKWLHQSWVSSNGWQFWTINACSIGRSAISEIKNDRFITSEYQQPKNHQTWKESAI